MKRFDENQFRTRVNAAIERVRTILDNTRKPQFPADVSHEYEDKYLLAEFVTNTGIAAYLNCLEVLGLNEKLFAQLKAWGKTRSVSLRLRAEEQTKFLRKTVREVESDTKQVTTSTLFGTRKDFTVTKITEYFWSFDAKWELVAFMGNESDKAVVLATKSGQIELKTSVDTTPKPASVVRPALDVNISWLLQNIEEEGNKPKFTIDRRAKDCHTPRRNGQIESALSFFTSFYHWAGNVHSYFTRDFFPVQSDHGISLASIQESSIFVPVQPLFEKPSKAIEDSSASSSSSSKSTSALPAALYASAFLKEQSRSMAEKIKELSVVFPSNDTLVTFQEAKLLVTLLHARKVAESHSECVDYIEDMLYKQLVAAIGKEVTPVDFTNYLNFHNRKLFKAEYQPRAFCHAIRRPDHYPEGTLSIEAQLDDGALASPINTIVSQSEARAPMYFPINASTRIAFNGDRYLHGWVSHQFSGYSGTQLSLVARARQFSSFILLVGRIASADLFEPKYGIIIQNKDDLKIPLLLETIPTPKEFKDAIESLSPEQQRFAKAFRSMQLESTLFAVCIIQIKPQLEKLLKLPYDSLTKEIQLMQDLLTLFIKYQIPSDLISYDGAANSSVASKIATVQAYVSNMQTMINKAKQTELAEAKEEQQYRLAENDSLSYSSAPMAMMARKSSASAPRSSSSGGGGGGPPPSAKKASFALPPSAPSGSSGTTQVTPSQPAPKPQTPGKPESVESTTTTTTAVVVGKPEDVVDYTKIPIVLEKKFEELDENNALHPTIINPSNVWTKKYQKALLGEPETTVLNTVEQERERNQAFDLLDALTKSGALSIDQASLHVVIAATHCFDKTLMNTVIQDNVNPIERVEHSSLIVASTIHQTNPAQLIAPEQLDRVVGNSPALFDLAPNKAVIREISDTPTAVHTERSAPVAVSSSSSSNENNNNFRAV